MEEMIGGAARMGWFVLRAVGRVAAWSFWVDRLHRNTTISGSSGPAVGRRSRRTWSTLVSLGRLQWYAAGLLCVALLIWLLWFA